MAGLVITDLTKSFDGQVVLDSLNLEAPDGTLLVVLGPSGCGKSTLLRLIAGLETPDRGAIMLDGRDITALEPQKRKTAMVFQNYALYPHMTVYENISFPLRVAKFPKSEIERLVRETACLLELEDMLGRRPSQLSGGQRQRVALGRGLVRQPSIFLLDEPLSNLDAALRVKMRQEIVALQRRLGITMIYVTHDQTEALTMADCMVVLKGGRMRQQGTPAEIYTNPDDRFVASFIGTPAINLFDDEISSGQGGMLPVRHEPNIRDGRYTIGIRPEHIAIDPEGPLTGEIIAVEYVGAVSHLQVRIGQALFTITDNTARTAHQIGQSVRLQIDSQRVYLFDRESGRRVR